MGEKTLREARGELAAAVQAFDRAGVSAGFAEAGRVVRAAEQVLVLLGPLLVAVHELSAALPDEVASADVPGFEGTADALDALTNHTNGGRDAD